MHKEIEELIELKNEAIKRGFDGQVKQIQERIDELTGKSK